MKITVFTGNQPRHVALIESLASIAHEVFAIQECTTLFPGRVPDFFRKSDVMQRYFARVIEAEHAVFGGPRFLANNVQQLVMRMGDLNDVDLDALEPAFDSDVFVVFGASYIKPPLIDFLIGKRAVNIHMGVSPYYRGSSCNFWAMYDRKPQLVGATIHLLGRGLDNGPMLCHALPAPEPAEPFMLGMLAVRAAHQGLARAIAGRKLAQLQSVPQDRSREIRYTRNEEFTDAVAEEYLNRLPTAEEIGAALKDRDLTAYSLPPMK
jgi:methionyl-tRNA formyltransferase